MTMTETARLEDAIRAGEHVEIADLIAAGAADRHAELVAEGALNAERDRLAAERLAEIDSILDGVADADNDPRLAELHAVVGPLIVELIERADARANVINAASNRLRFLDAIGGNTRPAEAWTGSLTDKRDPRWPRNYITGSSLDAVVAVLRSSLPEAIKVGLRGHQNF